MLVIEPALDLRLRVDPQTDDRRVGRTLQAATFLLLVAKTASRPSRFARLKHAQAACLMY
jgi:hypothetical protein